MNDIIIFGAGINGIRLSHILQGEVVFFCDNFKSGTVEGIKVLSFKEMMEYLLKNKADVILSVDNDSIRNQLRDNSVRFWEFAVSENNYFCREERKNYIDETLYSRIMSEPFCEYDITRKVNWFREDCYEANREWNEKLILAMKNEKEDLIANLLAEVYDQSESAKTIYEDELFDNRPGMRLAYKIIREMKGNLDVCDLACGHGELLSHLKSDRVSCFGVEFSVERCTFVNKEGINCRIGNIESTGYDSNKFDVVIAMECLEHVTNVFRAMREACRILKPGGYLIVTVPFWHECDSRTHVRQFKEEDLYSVAKMTGFDKIKIIRGPYLYRTYNDNLIMSAVKT